MSHVVHVMRSMECSGSTQGRHQTMHRKLEKASWRNRRSPVRVKDEWPEKVGWKYKEE